MEDYLKELEKAKKQLKTIQNLPDNWNNNGAEAFSVVLIGKCLRILNRLTYLPFMAPTADNSIQFEWEKDNGDYLEFNIFEEYSEMFWVDKNKNRKEKTIKSNDEQFIIDIVSLFFYQKSRKEHSHF